MVDKPVYFGLIPFGHVTLKSKEEIWPDYCGSHGDIS
jgi:hypothetical protein